MFVYAVTYIEKDRYTLIEQSPYYNVNVLFNIAVTNSTELAMLYS